MSKFLLVLLLLTLSLDVAKADVDNVSIYVYAYDCEAQPLLQANVRYDFYFYSTAPTEIEKNTYIYSGGAGDTVSITVNGTRSKRRLVEELMAENVTVCNHYLPDIRRQ